MNEELRISFMVPTGSSFEDAPDGSLIVHGVPIMCEGEWTSMDGRTVAFDKPDLKANCTNWLDNGIWTRHQLMPGENRPADLCVGGVQNYAYVDSFETIQSDGSKFKGAAAIGDLVFHRQTDASRDAATLIRLPKDQGGFRMVSAEIIMQSSEFDAKAKVYRPSKYAFGGLTIQRKGGCKACNIPAFAESTPGQETGNMAEEPKPDNLAPPTPGGAEGMPAWAKALSDKLDKLIGMEEAEAAKAGQGVANECNKGAGMSEKQPLIESFAAVEAKVKDLETANKTLLEEKRVLTAQLEKANSKPQGNFAAVPEAERLNSGIVINSMYADRNHNMHIRRG